MVEHLIRQRDYLLDISRALTSRLSLKDVLGRILRSAAEMLNGQAGLIALAEDHSFAMRATYGIPPEMIQHFVPLLSDIPRDDPDAFVIPELNQKMQSVAQAAGLGLQQVIALPMVVGSDLVGVIYIFREADGSFTRNEVRMLQSFADQAAIAVQNAHLYESVAHKNRRLDAVLRHSADGIMILNPDLTIESINLALSRITGWPIEEAYSAPYERLIHWAKREEGTDLVEAVARGWPHSDQNVVYAEGDLRNINGSTISVWISYAPLFNDHGDLAAIIANVRDITKFREADQAKATFISVVSHELKTPVSIIKGYASTLSRPDVEWKRDLVTDGLRVIEEEADRLAELIENLLDTTRLQFGRLSLSIREVQLDEMARKSAAKMSSQTDKHQIVADFPDDFPVIQGDEERLNQVITNLIGNAIKYSPDAGEIRITGSMLDDNRVQVSVSDQGIGIPADQHEFIFDRFYRVDNLLSRRTQGAGLGLYIVKSIIDAHGGQIWLDSQPDQGTVFSFTLPLSQY
jgi:PAS domain S-box-containing protein